MVILSPSFLAKGWPRRELNGLMAIEESGRKVILPVWHGIDKRTLAEYSPILADRLAVDTAQGIGTVAADIVDVVVRQGSGSPSAENPTVGRRFIELLESLRQYNQQLLGIEIRTYDWLVDAALSI